jgi:pimeloyl-ACP methyl ester carboxylesterase
MAYLYLELLEHLDQQVMLVGTSIGGWLAAEIVTKSDKHVAGVALVAPVGIKTGGREDRAFVDLYATRPDLVTAALYADPVNAPDLSLLSEQEMVALTTAQEAVARFAWEPYMHSPALAFRLARIRVPTLVVAGQQDRFTLEPEYYAAYTALIGDNAELALLPDAGHRVEEEAPALLCETIRSFFDRRVATSMAGRASAGVD